MGLVEVGSLGMFRCGYHTSYTHLSEAGQIVHYVGYELVVAADHHHNQMNSSAQSLHCYTSID